MMLVKNWVLLKPQLNLLERDDLRQYLLTYMSGIVNQSLVKSN